MDLTNNSKKALPQHIGIIMDGNGRWAQQRGKARTFGHNQGLQTAKKIVKTAADLGIKYVTLYTFSTENWKRAEEEVSFLMNLIKIHLKKEMNFYRENNIRVMHSGRSEDLPANILKEIDSVMKDTQHSTKLTVNLAINYAGRDEITRSINKHLSENPECQKLTEEDIQKSLDCPDFPDPDLIIRTAGEQRLSNFLLWQSAYSEFYFSDKLWPDWNEEDLITAVNAYQFRDRKFGGINCQTS